MGAGFRMEYDMPRFHMNIRKGDELFEDWEGASWGRYEPICCVRPDALDIAQSALDCWDDFLPEQRVLKELLVKFIIELARYGVSDISHLRAEAVASILSIVAKSDAPAPPQQSSDNARRSIPAGYPRAMPFPARRHRDTCR